MLKNILSTLAFVAFITLWIKGIKFIDPFLVSRDFFGNKAFTDLGWIVFAFILAPILEELAFRKVPLDFARKYNKATGQNYTIPIAIISSFIFASVHSNQPYNDICQGFGGFLLCLLYIRNGYKYWYNVLAHVGWNLSVTYLLPLIEKIW